MKTLLSDLMQVVLCQTLGLHKKRWDEEKVIETEWYKTVNIHVVCKRCGELLDAYGCTSSKKEFEIVIPINKQE